MTTAGAQSSVSPVITTVGLGPNSLVSGFGQYTIPYDRHLSGTLNVSLSPISFQTNFIPVTILANTNVAYSASEYGVAPLIEAPLDSNVVVPFDPYLSFDALFRPANLNIRRKIGRVRAASPQRSPELIAEWEGYVTQIDAQTFQARLRGISGKGVEGEVEDAIIPIREVGTRDNPQFAIGALFRLCISEIRSSDEEVQTSTKVVFRRLPAYRREDLEDARERARARAYAFRLDNRRTASGSE